ncbi:MAG: hypothetical protein RMN51_04405 [Verrucomicrobiota bacterium]|nr:hypothetical protein [Limisphaera sp.]MDW8381337.1 hypothetical protein [Verrucomicrobiota bacterium]
MKDTGLPSPWKKVALLLMAALLWSGVAQVERSMNLDRDRLGLTRVEPLQNAPPLLAFVTVALGGFRGLISNVLWVRMMELQEQDKFFEMKQLADWITKLEPHFVQVWAVQAWNMAYNISVKFKETEFGVYPDRWRWVKAGFELLRDEALKYNPYEPLLYRELAWIFQHKMGHILDDAHMYYKQQWANEMSQIFGMDRPNFEALLHPQSDEDRRRAELLTRVYKMDPSFLKKVDEEYGPLEWRLPESHAIYWAAKGLEMAAQNPRRVNTNDLIRLRRVIFQSMLMSFHRGRLIPDYLNRRFEFGPNLNIIPKVNYAYEKAMEEDPENRENIKIAHRNFLRDAVYFLYTAGRETEARRWYEYLAQHYPDKPLLEGRPETVPGQFSLDQYAVARVTEDVGETDPVRIRAHLAGMLAHAYARLILDQEDEALAFQRLARRVYESYTERIKGSEMRIGLPPFPEIAREVLRRLLDPQESPFSLEERAVLRTKLNLPAETTPLGSDTNAPAAAAEPSGSPASR